MEHEARSMQSGVPHKVEFYHATVWRVWSRYSIGFKPANFYV